MGTSKVPIKMTVEDGKRTYVYAEIDTKVFCEFMLGVAKRCMEQSTYTTNERGDNK